MGEPFMRLLIGLFIIFGGIALMLKDAPRALFDYQHADQFVAAPNLTITSAKCTNWNIALFDRCVVKFESRDGQLSGQITDWKFGRAPTGPVRLLRWRDDPSVVTTDISLQLVGDRLFFQFMVVLAAVFFLVCLTMKFMQRVKVRSRY